MIENKPFWMVVREGESANAPTRKHHTEEEAYTEAARLLKGDPHRRFWVLQAIGGFYNTMHTTTIEFSPPIPDRTSQSFCPMSGVPPKAAKEKGPAVEKIQIKLEDYNDVGIYLHPENKPELEGGCIVDGVKHTVKKPFPITFNEAYNQAAKLKAKCEESGVGIIISLVAKDTNEALGCDETAPAVDPEANVEAPRGFKDFQQSIEKPTKACITQTTAHLEAIRDHYKGLGLDLQFSIRPTL